MQFKSEIELQDAGEKSGWGRRGVFKAEAISVSAWPRNTNGGDEPIFVQVLSDRRTCQAHVVLTPTDARALARDLIAAANTVERKPLGGELEPECEN